MVKSKVRLEAYWVRLEVYQGPAGSVLGPARGVLLLRTILNGFMRIAAYDNENHSQWLYAHSRI
jgi:hypothetical protein